MHGTCVIFLICISVALLYRTVHPPICVSIVTFIIRLVYITHRVWAEGEKERESEPFSCRAFARLLAHYEKRPLHIVVVVNCPILSSSTTQTNWIFFFVVVVIFFFQNANNFLFTPIFFLSRCLFLNPNIHTTKNNIFNFIQFFDIYVFSSSILDTKHKSCSSCSPFIWCIWW